MLPLISLVTNIFKQDKFAFDSHLSFLHSKVTVAFLLLGIIASSSNAFFGKSISCHNDGSQDAFINDFCWANPTTTVTKRVDQLVPPIYPGIPSYAFLNGQIGNERLVNASFYQFSIVILIVQAATFLMPRFLWIHFSGFQLYAMTEDYPSMLNDRACSAYAARLGRYLCKTKGSYSSAPWIFLALEVLSLCNTAAQFCIIDAFFNYEISKNGWNVLYYFKDSPIDRIDGFNLALPKITKCVFKNYGSNGHPQDKDFICLITQNLLTEKIYAILGLWLMLLMILSMLLLVAYIALAFSPIKHCIIDKDMHMEKDPLATLTFFKRIGLRFIVAQLQRNLDQETFKKLVLSLCQKYD